MVSNPILPSGSAVNWQGLDGDLDPPPDDEVAAKSRTSLAKKRTRTPMGERINAALLRAGMSQNQLGKLLFPNDPHDGRGRISRYISGARGQVTLDVELFQRMAQLLDVSFGWLVVGEGPMERHPEKGATHRSRPFPPGAPSMPPCDPTQRKLPG
jgi:transcriptional regulator with XRE-family HTH domain